MSSLFVYSLFFIIGIFLSYLFFPLLMDMIVEGSEKRGFYNGPWKTHLGIGKDTIPKIEKSAIARVGLGANSSEETIYWNAFTDPDGNPLISKFSYVIELKADLPIDFENQGFWSITIYGHDKFLVENTRKKYMFRYSADDKMNFSFPIVINLKQSGGDNSEFSIPLPIKNEKFSIALRCYRPLQIMQNQITCSTIQMPSITKIC